MLKIRRSTWLSAALAACALACFGCSSSADDVAAAGSGGGGGGGQADLPTSLAFEPSATLKMIPGEPRDVTVVATPAKSYPVHFVLVGQFEDASIDRSEVMTGDDGRATIQLVAPTTPTTFSLRASVGESVTTQAGVSVSASGFATLQVEPSYSGKRSISGSGWVASVRAGSSCSDLVGNPPPDGDLKASSLPTQVPQIDGVPVGPTLAVSLRAGYYIYGCKELDNLTAGEINQVVIPVSDVPLKVEETDLLVDLTMNPPPQPLDETFGPALQAATNASLGGAADDVQALLEAMQLVTPTAQDAAAFDAQSLAGGWQALLTTTLGGPVTAPTATRNKIQAWLVKGAQSLDNAKFSGTLTSAGKGAGQAYLELDSVAGVDAGLAGFTKENLASWQSDPGDTVLLGTTLFAIPSRLFSALATAPALAAAPGANSVPGAIADLLSCDNVATALVTAGAASGQSYPGCDATCTKTLCRAALSVQWERVQDATAASGGPAATLVLSATGDATVDEYARPTSFDGSWVGTLGAGKLKTSVGGSASGQLPPPPK